MDEITLARFMCKIEVQPNGCWRWTGKPNRQGYGRFWLDGKSRYAHRIAHEHFIGPIPDGYEVDHLCHTRDASCPGGICDHRLCVRWTDDHLEAVTERENVMRSRGRAPANAAKTECDEGHPFDGGNTFFDSRGDRGCKTCQKRRLKDWAKVNRPADGPSNAAKTHCPNKHPYDEANTRISRGRRTCIECTRKKDREGKARRRAALAAASA